MRIILLMSLLVLSACAVSEQYKKRVCHYDGAFEQGTNDAQAGEQMNGESLAHVCPENTKAQVRKGYREGYTSARAQGHRNNAQEIYVFNGKEPPRECREAYGRKVCGYGCVEAYGKVRCAKSPRNKCMEGYGKIVCGRNCTEEYGKVNCEVYE